MGTTTSKSRKSTLAHPQGAPRPVTPIITNNEVTSRDVMISYSHTDAQVMRKIKTALEMAGLSVWVDESALSPGAMYLREIGEAIVACKLFIVILSSHSVQSKYCQDEVSLAYISNKSIYAASVLPFDEISAVMDLGMKLTLSCVHWSFLDDKPDDALTAFVGSIKSALDKLSEEVKPTEEQLMASDESADEELFSTSVMNRQALAYRLKEKRESFNQMPNVDDSAAALTYWNTNFGGEASINWNKFVETVMKEMSEMWKNLGVVDDTRQHLFTLMKKEMKVANETLQKSNFLLFCKHGKEMVALDEAIKLYAAEAIAVREVFDIDSSVRLTAIANLGDQKSKKVIKVLLDLLYDEDQDVRVVAAIALAHAASDIKKPKVRSEVVNGLLSCLNNDDRLVRESGCLALGRMKSKTAIKKLVFLWRNDYISTVREAAQIAIKQIGGEEAELALHVTKVLSDEIQLLKT